MIRAALVTVLLAGPATAQSVAPSFDCARGDSDAETAICTHDGLAEMDNELSRLYGLAMAGLTADTPRHDALRQSERDWVRDRRDCWRASIGLETCVANAYAMRIHDLREGYAGARSDDAAGISTGPVAWACDGLDALVSAVFVNGSQPMVSLRWLDRQMALPGVPSGSGAKYASDLWDGGPSLFCIHGNEALFAPPGGAEMTCHQEPVG